MRSSPTQHWPKVSHFCSHRRRQRTTLSRQEEPGSPRHKVTFSAQSQERLVGAMLVQKCENVVGPDFGSKIAEGVAVSRGVAVGGENLQFVGLARLGHFL